jgi:hypothetical protein
MKCIFLYNFNSLEEVKLSSHIRSSCKAQYLFWGKYNVICDFNAVAEYQVAR